MECWKSCRNNGKEREENVKNIIVARNEAAKKFASVQKCAKQKGKRVRKGELQKIIKECTEKHNIAMMMESHL